MESSSKINISGMDTFFLNRQKAIINAYLLNTRPRGFKTFSMLNLAEHEILNAHKYKKYQEN